MTEILLEFKELPFIAAFIYVVVLFLKHIKSKDDNQVDTLNKVSQSLTENTTILRELKDEIKKR